MKSLLSTGSNGSWCVSSVSSTFNRSWSCRLARLAVPDAGLMGAVAMVVVPLEESTDEDEGTARHAARARIRLPLIDRTSVEGEVSQPGAPAREMECCIERTPHGVSFR